MTNQELNDVCPAQAAWDVVSGKWKPCIIHVLSQAKIRFNELHRSVPGVTQRMLTRQLRELERDGLVARFQYNQVPVRVEYELTELGRSILPVFTGLTDWWADHGTAVERARRRQTDTG